MNSFYGQMRWGEKFEQFFYEFRLTNEVFSKDNAFNKDPEKDGFLKTLKNPERAWIQPNEDYAIFHINTANHWIGIIPFDSKGDDPSKETKAGFSLFHQSPDLEDTETLTTLDPTPEEDLEVSLDKVVQLKSGEYIKVIDANYDMAGHFTGVEDGETQYFKLPSQIIKIDKSDELHLKEKDQKFYFNKDPLDLIKLTLNGSFDELTFNHATFFNKDNVPEDLNLIQFLFHEKYEEGKYPEGFFTPTVQAVFEPGDFIITQQMTFDQGGHLIDIKEIYYQLPISETDERLTKIESTLSEINADLTVIKGDITNLKTKTEELASVGARIGTDTAFKELGIVIGLLTGKSPNTNFSLATGLADSLTFINDDFKHVHTSIYAYLDHVSAFLADKLGYKKPSL